MYRRHFLAAAAGVAAGTSQSARAQVILDARAYRARRRYASTRFGRIAYVEHGNGPAAGLFLHGFPLNGFQWRGAMERLAYQRRCVAPDFMAMGFTEVAEGQSVAPDAQVAMLAEFLDALSLSAVDVIANDSGGAVGQLLITRHPHRVRSLLLTNCDTEPECPPSALRPVIELSRAGTYADQWLVPWLANKASARSEKGIGGMCYVDPAHPTDEALECYFGPLVASPRRKALIHAFALALERNALAGIEPALKKCKIPTRIVWGTGDTIFSPASVDYLSNALGNCRGVRRLEGRKLFWPEELPEVVAEEAKALWQEV